MNRRAGKRFSRPNGLSFPGIKAQGLVTIGRAIVRLRWLRAHDVPAWIEQARAELRAAGEATAAPAVRATDVLTAQQLQIARLVCDGATNREVAAQLFLSPRTVDHHMRNIFARLGIRSRIELSKALT